jgi:hypothetical protein
VAVAYSCSGFSRSIASRQRGGMRAGRWSEIRPHTSCNSICASSTSSPARTTSCRSSTVAAPSDAFSAYNCSGADERGPENAYLLLVDDYGTLEISVDDTDADIDVHLLDAAEEGQPNAGIWDGLGLRERVPLRRPDLLRRERWRGVDVEVPHGFAPWIAALEQAARKSPTTIFRFIQANMSKNELTRC